MRESGSRTLRSDLIDPTIALHHGRVVKRTGDGIVIEFRSVVDAVRFAIEVQNGMVERNFGGSWWRRTPPPTVGGRVLRRQRALDVGGLLVGGLGVGEAVRVVVESAQAVERLREVGPVGGRVLRGQRPPDVGGLLVGGLGVGEPVRVVVESAQAVERPRQVGPVGGGVLRRQRPPDAGVPICLEQKPHASTIPPIHE